MSHPIFTYIEKRGGKFEIQERGQFLGNLYSLDSALLFCREANKIRSISAAGPSDVKSITTGPLSKVTCCTQMPAAEAKV